VIVDRCVLEKRDHRERTAEGHEPGLQPLKEDLAGERERDRPERQSERDRTERDRARTVQQAFTVRPQLVGDAAADKDEDEGGVGEHRQREAGDGDQRQRDISDERAAEADDRTGDERADRGVEPVEERVEIRGQVGLDVEGRQRQHEDETGQHEADASCEAAELARPGAAEVHAELMGFRPRKHLVDGKGLAKGLVRDPVLLVDAFALEHGDLGRRPAPGESAELEESPEDGRPRIGRSRPGAAVGFPPHRGDPCRRRPSGRERRAL
jgi:hypothetical protein